MSETNIQNQKESFLKSEFFMLSWTAAVQQRNRGQRLFKDNISDEKKNEFKKNLFKFTEDILKTYKTQRVNANVHHENLLQVHKLFEMILTDGIESFHCRSIFCAEYSHLVQSHWRFIITKKS